MKQAIKVLILSVGIVTVGADLLAAGKLDRISVELKTDRVDILLGEPIMIEAVITLKNGPPLEFTNPLDRGEYDEALEIAAPMNAEFNRFVSDAEAVDALEDRATKLPRVRLVPSEPVVRRFTVWCWPMKPEHQRLVVFASPGQHRVRFTIRLAGEEIVREMTIRVHEPTTVENRRAWELINDDATVFFLQHATFLTRGAESQTRVLERINSLLSECPNSVYARYGWAARERSSRKDVNRRGQLRKL